MFKSTRLGLISLGIASTIMVPALAQDPLTDRHSSVLTLEEHARAVQIAAPRATARSFNLDPNAPRTPEAPNREVVTNVEAVGVGKSDSRRAVVTLYRYDGNVAINRLIDIDSGRVLRDERLPNGAAPVAEIETEYATTLLQANPRVRQLMAAIGNDAAFSFRLAPQTADRRNALFGKRVVSAQIYTADGYVGGAPAILVNLTDGTVIVGQ
jgi:hypothetical protein